MKFSKIQLGTVQFGLNYGIANTSGKPSYEKARDIIAAAHEGGVNTLDTAAAYGDSEEILGRALAELNLRDQFQIISKIPPLNLQNPSPEEVERNITKSVETSLRRLRLERLTVCLFHKEGDLVYLDALRKLQERGLVEGCGVSLDSATYCDRALEEKIRFIQLPYNIFDKRFDDFLPKASADGVRIFTRSLYLQGLLLMPENQIKPFLHEVIPVRRKLENLAGEAGMSMPELCVRFVLAHPAITSVLTGVDDLSQLQQNISLMGKGPLPEDLYAAAKRIVPTFSEEIIRPVNWTKHV